jgi:hypothetical protein
MRTPTPLKSPLFLILALAAGIILNPAPGRAIPQAIITWGTATNISGDTDVSTAGTLFGAYNVGNSAGALQVTLNGVTFQPFVITTNPTTVGNFSLSETPATLLGTNSFGSSSAPFTGLSSNYQNLLDSAGYANEADTMTLTISGLMIGQQYQFEWWDNSSFSSAYSTTATAGNSIALNSDTTNTAGGLGQYVIGTFTANATNEPIAFSSVGNGPAVNAFQVRTVPEPSTWVLAFGGVGLLALQRRRRLAKH